MDPDSSTEEQQRPIFPSRVWGVIKQHTNTAINAAIVVIVGLLITWAAGGLRSCSPRHSPIRFSEPLDGASVPRCIDLIRGTGSLDGHHLWIGAADPQGQIRIVMQAEQTSPKNSGTWHAGPMNIGISGDRGVRFQILALDLDGRTSEAFENSYIDLTDTVSKRDDDGKWRLVFRGSVPSGITELSRVDVVRTNSDRHC